mmetsp:Transcript_16172/g.11678  ORF Transcript_16172/g.11678 Transcript_16172/m.11678 type:complete len:84 (+) Transcript_16172:952-1203(+)
MREDQDLMTMDLQFKSLMKEFNKSNEEIASIYCRVSGRLNKMRDFLIGKQVEEWSYLEDLALEKPEDSQEFQVILQTKGWNEI